MADLQYVRILNIFLVLLIWSQECTSPGVSANAHTHTHKLGSRVTNILGNRNGQPDRNTMKEPHPLGNTLRITVSPTPDKTAKNRSENGTAIFNHDDNGETANNRSENGSHEFNHDTEENYDDNDSDILGPVIGTVLGALLLLAIITFIIILQRRKLREAKLRMNNDTSRDNHKGNSDSINVAVTKGSVSSPQPRSIPDNEYSEIGHVEDSGAHHKDDGKYNDDSPSNHHNAHEKSTINRDGSGKYDVILPVSLIQNYDRLREFKKEDNEDISFNAYDHSSTNTQKSYDRLKFTKDNDSKSSEGYDRWNASSDDKLNLTKL